MPWKDSKSDRDDSGGSRDYIEYLKILLRAKSDPVYFLHDLCHIDLFPKQEEILREFYRHKYNPSLPPYKRLICAAGMRGGKTALGSMIGTYEFFDIITLDNPATQFGLLPNQPIFISMVAASESQIQDGVYANMSAFIEGSEFFATWLDVVVKSSEITCPKKNVTVRLLSSWIPTGVGRSNILVELDELVNFEDTAGKRGAWEVYTRLVKSTDTFGVRGKVVAISSLKQPNDIMMTLYKRGEYEPNTLRYLIPTWEMNPNLTKEELMAEHKFDMGAFWRDYGCQPGVYSSLMFPEGIQMQPMTNVLQSKVATPTIPHIMAIDPAVRNDAFGVGCGYVMDDKVVIDGVTRFTKTSELSYIRPTEILEFLREAIPRLFVTTLISDTWMFPEIAEMVEEEFGVQFLQNQVGKITYDKWRELQSMGRVRVVENLDLKMEAESLIVSGTGKPKVDHPLSGSKDMADCVANIIWHLTEGSRELDQLPNLLCVRVI